MKTVDVRNLACPGPVLKLRELLEAGEMSIQLQVADDLARSNVSRFAASRGARVEAHALEGGGFTLTVNAGPGAQEAVDSDEEYLNCELPAAGGPTVVQVTAETMGTGDDELGTLLMRSFVKTLAQLPAPPHTVLFYNGGVRLCCEGSTLIEDIAALEKSGTEILACGTCLNFYGLADQLAVGRGTDMLEIASRLNEAGRVLRP